MRTYFESGFVKDYGDLKGEHTVYSLTMYILNDHPSRKAKHKWDLEGAQAHVAEDGTVTIIWPDGTKKPIPFVGAKTIRNCRIMAGYDTIMVPIKDGKVVMDRLIMAPWSHRYGLQSNTMAPEKRWDEFMKWLGKNGDIL